MTATPSSLRLFTDKLFGGIRMTWLRVILFAAATAVVTAIFLIVPFFLGTSFQEMGVSFEAWILFAIIIMTNCEKPLESALKTFVFFLISQPLIYLLQVPFYYDGFGIFMYYRTWFIWTLFTFPMAFVGWYLRKRNWLSLLILSPVIVILALYGTGYASTAILRFPDHIIAAIFCFGQILLYLYAFFDDWKKQLVGLVAAIAAVAVIAIAAGPKTVSVATGLPGQPTLSEDAVVVCDDNGFQAQIIDYSDPFVEIEATKYGTTGMTVTDGGKTYRYSITVKWEDKENKITVTPEASE